MLRRGGPAAEASPVVTVRTFKPRRSRITAPQREALEVRDALVATPAEVAGALVTWPGPVVMEIGFGTGSATVEMAAADPATLVVACDIHTPGVGELLRRARERGLENVRVVEADALDVLREHVPTGRLDGVRSYFPDPWPKARHRKRRLVEPERIALIASRVRHEGSWELATDWADYVDHALAALHGSGLWTGGIVERPVGRPVTRYEARALREGRTVTDLRFLRTEVQADATESSIGPFTR